MVTPDAALYERWRATRDPDAFAEIVARHSAMVYSTCKRVLGNPTDAEDAAQECFIELARARKNIRCSLGGWLHRVAVRRSLNRIRSESRRKHREHRFVERANMDNDTTWDDVQAHIDEAIAALPDKLREPIICRFLEGRTQNAIARSLGISSSTVQYRLSKGIEEMRKFLKKRGVVAPSAVLLSLLSKHLTAEAAPATLTAALGKLTLAGATGAVTAAAGTSATSIAALAGLLVMKKAIIGIALILVGGLGIYVVTQKQLSRPVQRAPEGNVTTQQHPSAEESGVLWEAEPEILPKAAPVALQGGVVTGRVYDEETGEGIYGVQVKAHAAQSGRRSGEGETDSDGAYRIEGLAQGEYTVELDNDIYGYYNPSDGTQTVVLVQVGTESKNVNFALREGTFVQGKVVDIHHVPIADAEVSIRTRDNRHASRAQSGPDGTFLLAGVPISSELFIQPSRTGYALAPRGPFEAPDGGLQDVLLVMGPESSIEGTIVDTGGNVLEGLRVLPSPRVSPASVYSRFKSEPSDSEGRFKVRGLFPDSYTFSIGLPGETRFVPLEDAAPVEVGLGEKITGLVLVCDLDNTIEGTVANTQGAPIAGALVEARGLFPPVHVMRTDLKGRYVLRALRPGLYEVRVSHPGYGQANRPEIPAGSEHVDFVLEACGALAGQVIDARTGEPVITYEINTKQVQDAEGRFLLEDVPPGQLRVHVRAPGYTPHTSETVVVRPGETTYDLIVRLEQGAIIEGVVLSPQGKPVKDARLFLDRPPISQIVIQDFAEAVTGNDGTFRIESVPPEAETIYAYHPQYAPASEVLRQGGGIVNQVELTLGTGGVVQGFVRAGGEPLRNVGVTIGDMHPAVYQDHTSEDGSYRIEGLGSGPVQVVVMTSFEGVQNPHGRKQTKMAYIEQGFITEVDFDLDLWDTEVEGRVTINGEPSGSTKVLVALLYALQADDSDMFNVVADENGHYIFRGPRPGPATMRVWPLGLVQSMLTTADDLATHWDTLLPSKPVHIVEGEITRLDFDIEISE